MPFFPQPTGTSAARSPHASSCFWLRSHRPSGPRGLCTTQAGPLLKHQIPIRTFHGWDNAHPGFLEADLVAHNGGDSEGCSLYTFSLTDGTECLPLLYKSPEAVLAAFQQARVLFPFPILGLDTDNGQVRLQMTATPQAIQLLPDVRLWQARLALESGDLQNAACLLETLDLEEHMAPRIFQARLLLVQQKPETARRLRSGVIS